MSTLTVAARAYFEGNVAKHKANVALILANPVAVAEHPDIIETLACELDKVAHYKDLLAALTEVEEG